MSLGGSFYSPAIEDYYATPWDLGYGHLVKFDHEFVGREALEAMADEPHRRKVTLVWNADDVLGVFQRLLEDGPLPMHIELPLAATARMHYDKVLGEDGEIVGVATYPTYSVNERAMLSLATSRRRTPNRAPRSCSCGARTTAARGARRGSSRTCRSRSARPSRRRRSAARRSSTDRS